MEWRPDAGGASFFRPTVDECTLVRSANLFEQVAVSSNSTYFQLNIYLLYMKGPPENPTQLGMFRVLRDTSKLLVVTKSLATSR